jgi:hypothetical protein
MLEIARSKLVEYKLEDRVSLFQGYVLDLPRAPLYSAATYIETQGTNPRF